MKLLVATRIHNIMSSSFSSTEKLLAFVQSCQHYAEEVMVCVGSETIHETLNYIEEATSVLSNAGLLSMVTIQCVHPWGNFTAALNASICHAQKMGYSHLVFQSLEFRIPEAFVMRLLCYFNDDAEGSSGRIGRNTLVVGPAMDGHQFTEGANIQLTGRSTPWNTFAIWNLELLSITGFPLIAEGIQGKRETGGVEEVAAIALLQHINTSLRSYLVDLQNVESDVPLSWLSNFATDPARQDYHDFKMRSKIERPAQQMAFAGIPAGRVEHITEKISV